MYSVLVVDDDTTCLLILEECLKKWNYQVMTVNHAVDALCILREKSYDIVLVDVHMPDMDGFELQQHINQEFNLPVILISGDDREEAMLKGIKNGAQCYMVKPICPDDVKDIWQYSEWWKINKINNIARPSHHDKPPAEKRTRKVLWTPNLHNRFVEAIFLIGYHRAVPTNILEVMNVQGLTRQQVASHLQKYQKFLKGLLDGSTTDLVSSRWMDLNYYSSYVNGNPNIMLINQLKEEVRNGKFAAPVPLRPYVEDNINVNVPAANASLSSPFTQAEASSSRSRNGGANNNIFAPSTASINVGGQGSNILFNWNNFNCNQQLGNVQPDPNIAISLPANQFGNTSAMNAQQLGRGQMTDESWFKNNGVIPRYNSRLGFDPNLIQGDNDEAYKSNMMNKDDNDDDGEEEDDDDSRDDDDDDDDDEDFDPEGEF